MLGNSENWSLKQSVIKILIIPNFWQAICIKQLLFFWNIKYWNIKQKNQMDVSWVYKDDDYLDMVFF